MTQQRLNYSLILHVHQEETDNLNLTEVAQEKDFLESCVKYNWINWMYRWLGM